MKGFASLAAIVGVTMAGCAGNLQTEASPQDSHHAVTQHSEVCVAASEQDIAALFDRWNESLKTGDASQVVAINYAKKSVLLPTVSSKPRLTVSEKEDYFHHFLENGPIGRIDSRTIELDCNTAIDEGLYTFTFQTTGAQVKARYTFTYKWDGKQWLITSHHSSTLPAVEAAPEETRHAVAQHPEVCVPASEQDIAALFDRYNESLQTGDAHQVVVANYAAKSVLFPFMSTKPRLTLDDKEDYFHHFLANKPVVVIDSRTIELDCNTAIDEGLYTITFRKTGAQVKARYTFTYKWDGKQWLITSHHSSTLPAVEAAPDEPHHAVAQHSEVCVAASEQDIAALFDRWNNSLQTGDARTVVATNYAARSIFLPLLSTKPRLTLDDKEDYFQHVLANRPVVRVDSRTIELDCNTAIDEGLYTFTFQTTGTQVKARYTFIYKWDGKRWLITSHHASTLPSEEAPPEEPQHAVAQHSEVCMAASEQDVIALFDRYNESLKTGNAHKVVAHYAAKSVFLPMLSTKPRLTLDDKEDYFHRFLENKPVMHNDSRTIELDCNTAIDEGLSTFTFQTTGAQVKARYTFIYKWDGRHWLITSHHSSALPAKE